MKHLEDGGYIEFINYYFPKNYPDLRAKFPDQIKWSLISPPYLVQKPETMTFEDFDQFRLIELEWLIENGYQPKSTSAPLFVTPRSGVNTLQSSEVRNIEKITDSITSIIISNASGVQTFEVIGNVNYVYKKFGGNIAS